jgi:hypothetical protein
MPEGLRKRLLAAIGALRKENAPRIRDPQYRSLTGYNIAEWADRGYGESESIVRDAKPGKGQTLQAYGARLLRLLQKAQTRYSESPADEDGGGAGAVVDAIRALHAELARDSG